jgi:hypothetical protein
MLSRILGVIACMFPMGWGSYSMYQGLNNGDFGPILGGIMFLIIDVVAALIIIGDGLEQKVNGTPDNILEDGTIFEFKTAPRIRHSANDPAEFDRLYSEALERMNTPDPHLIHPDHAKRQASGHDSYPRVDMKV